MRKKRAKYDERKMMRRHFRKEWPLVDQSFEKEIKPLLGALKNSDLDTRVRGSLGNYLIIRLVSMMEYFFSNKVAKIVDERDLDASRILDEESLEEQKKQGHAAGQIVLSTFSYENYDQIQYVFSALLDLDFFGTVRALDSGNPYKYVKGAISLEKNFEEFKAIFDLRHEIVHGMKDANLSIRKFSSLVNNTINVLDAASWICHPEFKNRGNSVIYV